MSRAFYLIWLIVGAILFGVLTVGLAALSQFSLNPTGRVPPVPWDWVLGAAVGITVYWSALCWTLGLLRKKPLYSAIIAGVTLAVAYGYPAVDQSLYARQQDQIATTAITSAAPDLDGKTALYIWPYSDACSYNCWNLTTSMQSRVVSLMGEAAMDVDFSQPVDLSVLTYTELLHPDGDVTQPHVANPAVNVTIDYVILHIAGAQAFDGVFDDLLPSGIRPDGLSIDAMIVPVADPTAFSLSDADPILRLSHVSRTTATAPYLPFNGRVRYWNQGDRVANLNIALPYFCSRESREPHWCRNAFD